jgi:hypothetical protein
MNVKEKSEIQKAADLLEANGYHVLKVEKMTYRKMVNEGYPTGTMSLRIAPKEEKKNG